MRLAINYTEEAGCRKTFLICNSIFTNLTEISCDIQQQHFTATLSGSVTLYNHEEDTLGSYKDVNCEQRSRERYSCERLYATAGSQYIHVGNMSVLVFAS
jgi:hypothetical protein